MTNDDGAGRFFEGWFWPRGAFRAHYLREGVSLCGHFHVSTILLENADRFDNHCRACERALARERREAPRDPG